ncbi:MAG: four helix bundle protein [bacterium]
MNHKELEVWKKGMELAKSVYELTREFPSCEAYGLTSQMRRAAVSVPSNIAEGAARGADNDFARFLRIALSSLSELETQVILARDLGYTAKCAELLVCIESVQRLLMGMIRHLKSK